MTVSVERATLYVQNFLKKYQGAKHIAFKIRETQEEVYGKHATIQKYGRISGGYSPRPYGGMDSRGRRGWVGLVCSNVRDDDELRRTLNHEVLGHYGALTLTIQEKQKLLDVIMTSRDTPSLASDWIRADKEYLGKNESWKAEEIFCFVAEDVGKRQSKKQNAAQVWASVIENQTRQLERFDLETLTDALAHGIQTGERTQQIFPQSNQSQFRSKYMPKTSDNTKSTNEEKETEILSSEQKIAIATINNKKSTPENAVETKRTGRELEDGEFVLPRRITQNYTEQNNKFYLKDSNRLAFENKNQRLTTSTVDKAIISDMVLYARAKQWSNLKLSGSEEFRREAWLQAESQGIKTRGFTPKESDLAALKTLTEKNSTNVITPQAERHKSSSIPTKLEKFENLSKENQHITNRNQASIFTLASLNQKQNISELRSQPPFHHFPEKTIEKIAFYRGVLQAENKHYPQTIQQEKIAAFDQKMQDSSIASNLPELTQKTPEKINAREQHNQQQSL